MLIEKRVRIENVFRNRKFKNVIKRSENTEYVRPCVASETNFSSKKETSSSFKHYVVALLSTMASHFEVLDINYTVENLLLEIEYEYSNKK